MARLWAVTGVLALLPFTRVNWDDWQPDGWSAPSPAVELEGLATYYTPGLMDQVARHRGLDLSGTVGGVALMRAGDLGRKVWIRFPGGMWSGPYRVVDCARRDHYAGNLSLGHVVELSRATWLAHDLPEYPVHLTVRFLPPWPPQHGRPWPR